MVNIGQLAQVVQQNCDISDAQYAGNYSMCIFLLKMREYYRWENQIPLSQSLATENVGDWIVARENGWEALQDQHFHLLPLEGDLCDPFDAKAINHHLVPQGYVYSSGFGIFNKPLFFLGQLNNVQQQQDVTIYSSSCEYARDLVAPPAMSLDNTIFIRQEPLRRFIWEKIEEWRLKRDPNVPMAKVLTSVGIDIGSPHIDNTALEHALDILSDSETANMVLHELGETEAGKILGPAWEDMLYQVPRSATQFTLRAVRDHLADCRVVLPKLLQAGRSASLHFYFANFTGMRKEIFPELLSAYQQWAADLGGDIRHTTALREIVAAGSARWRQVAVDILSAFEEYGSAFDREVTAIIESSAAI